VIRLILDRTGSLMNLTAQESGHARHTRQPTDTHNHNEPLSTPLRPAAVAGWAGLGARKAVADHRMAMLSYDVDES
jgi:hypothetical protein